IVDGVSTIDNYRSQFKRVLRQGSYATLVAQLRAKLGEETLMFAHASVPPSPAATRPADTIATTRPAAPRATGPRVAAAPVKVIPAAPVNVVRPAPVKVIPPAVVAPPVVGKSTDATVARPIVAAATRPASSTSAVKVIPPATAIVASTTTPRSTITTASKSTTSSASPAMSYVAMAPATGSKATVDTAAIDPVIPPAADVLSPV